MLHALPEDGGAVKTAHLDVAGSAACPAPLEADFRRIRRG